MKNILKVIVALGVFTMTIGSSFAMDTNPPTEPVKTTVETEVVAEVQPSLVGYGYYDPFLNECVEFTGILPIDCSSNISTVYCLINVDDLEYHLYEIQRETEDDPWMCTIPLYKVL